MTNKIIVANYDPKWALQFEELKTTLLEYIGIENLTIAHVGSTSIPGLPAKPIIDLDIIIADDGALLKRVITKLGELGYAHVGDLGITGREAFKKASSKTPDTGTGRDWFPHHLYLCKQGSLGLQNHLFFRDYMRSHPNKIEEYGLLKQDLAIKYPYDIDAYIDGKTSFIIEILHKAGMEKANTQQIDGENRMK